MANIPNLTDGDILNAAELFKLVAEDQTGGSILNSTTETMIGETQLTAGQASEGILVIATGKVTHDLNVSNTSTIKLYTGENASFGSNTLRKTITRIHSDLTDSSNDTFEVGWTLTAFISAETWANPIYVQVTGDNSVAHADMGVTCESLVVIGV